MKKQTETDIVRSCLQLLELYSILAWRANAGGGLRRGRGGRMVPVKANSAGTPDILAVCRHQYTEAGLPCSLATVGRLVAIECKRPGGKLRDSQVAWAENATRAGALCLVVTSDRELEEALRKEGYIP